MATVAELALLVIVALVFITLLVQFVRGWRMSRKVARACPIGAPCAAKPTEQETTIPQEPEKQPEEEYMGCPAGACPFKDSVYGGASECGPSCTCARCRDGAYVGKTRGGQMGVRECTSLIQVDDALRSQDAVMLFWMTGCGPCSAFKPTYQAAALKINVPLYAVDFAMVPEVVDRFSLKGFPTVYRFKGGQWHSEYNGNRTEADFLAWISN